MQAVPDLGRSRKRLGRSVWVSFGGALGGSRSESLRDR